VTRSAYFFAFNDYGLWSTMIPQITELQISSCLLPAAVQYLINQRMLIRTRFGPRLQWCVSDHNTLLTI